MSQRYLLVAGTGGGEMTRFVERLRARSGLRMAFSSGRIAALVDPSLPCIAVGSGGCILGSLFHRSGAAHRLASLTGVDAAAILRNEGDGLLHGFWGGYVAALEAAGQVRILRDPSGLLPCYYARCDRFLLFASDADLLFDAGADATVDFEEIGRQLYRAFVPAATTALAGIHELLAGFALRVPATDGGQLPIWSPWDHVADREVGWEELSSTLSSIVRHCVGAWASAHGRVLLSVSGGLDSSILAACLVRSGTETICLTMFSGDPIGDERIFARALCNRLGLPLVEWPYRLEDIDIGAPLAPHLPRPRDRTQALAYERAHLEVAREMRADAFITGNGGDSVFGYSQSAAPVADLYLAHGLGSAAFKSLVDVCRQTGCSITDAARQAWRLAHRPPAFPVAPKPLLLAPDFVAGILPAMLHHPWLDAPEGALPGKAAHIASIVRVQSHLEAGRASRLPVLSPLMSQPLVETCLSIPSWEWRAGGRDRSVARRAFARDLPPIVRDRRVKGSPSGFGAKLLDHFRKPIRERLLDGRLAAAAIVDRAAIEQVLGGERPVPHAERVRMLELVNAEAWIDRWTARQPAEPLTADIRQDGHGRPRPADGPIP
jgi:asparagine synthase (glutamine-hydrolysing)